jgi:hypothetical protein
MPLVFETSGWLVLPNWGGFSFRFGKAYVTRPSWLTSLGRRIHTLFTLMLLPCDSQIARLNRVTPILR